jgi:hypothetical protein
VQPILMWLVVTGLLGIAVYAQSSDPKERARRARERARRALARAENTPIADVKDGEWARVTGITRAIGSEITSPASGRPCIGFWRDADSACGPFTISDETGLLIVEGPFERTFEIEELFSTVPAEHLEFLDQIGVLPRAGHGLPTVREALLRAGQRVSVLGLAFLEPDPDSPAAGLRAVPLVRRMRGSKQRPILLGDPGPRRD